MSQNIIPLSVTPSTINIQSVIPTALTNYPPPQLNQPLIPINTPYQHQAGSIVLQLLNSKPSGEISFPSSKAVITDLKLLFDVIKQLNISDLTTIDQFEETLRRNRVFIIKDISTLHPMDVKFIKNYGGTKRSVLFISQQGL